MQSTGAFYAASRLAGATIPPAHVVNRSIGLQVQCHQVFQFDLTSPRPNVPAKRVVFS